MAPITSASTICARHGSEARSSGQAATARMSGGVWARPPTQPWAAQPLPEPARALLTATALTCVVAQGEKQSCRSGSARSSITSFTGVTWLDSRQAQCRCRGTSVMWFELIWVGSAECRSRLLPALYRRGHHGRQGRRPAIQAAANRCESLMLPIVQMCM